MKRIFTILVLLSTFVLTMPTVTAYEKSPPGVFETCNLELPVVNAEFSDFTVYNTQLQDVAIIISDKYVKRSNRGAIIFSFTESCLSYYGKPERLTPLRC